MSEKKITLNAGQKEAMARIEEFLQSPRRIDSRDPVYQVFILKGFAGTGKTTMVKNLVEYMRGQYD